MKIKTFADLIADVLPHIRELMPWDVEEMLLADAPLLIVDIREPDEYVTGKIAGSLNIPRGKLEMACDWGYADTVPDLVKAREQPVILVCRSGNRTALAAFTLQQMGYQQVYSLKTGIRGWNDYELPLWDPQNQRVDSDVLAPLLDPSLGPDQVLHKKLS